MRRGVEWFGFELRKTALRDAIHFALAIDQKNIVAMTSCDRNSESRQRKSSPKMRRLYYRNPREVSTILFCRNE